LVLDCAPLLQPSGWLMLEHGADQMDDVAAILDSNGWTEISCHNDLGGLPRVTAARHSGK